MSPPLFILDIFYAGKVEETCKQLEKSLSEEIRQTTLQTPNDYNKLFKLHFLGDNKYRYGLRY